MPILPTQSFSRRRAGAIALISLASAMACLAPGETRAQAAESQAQPSGTAASHSPAATYDSFGFALLRRLAAAAPGRNVVISPAGAGITLAMALEGAAGDTRDSLAVMLGFLNDPGAVTQQNRALLTALHDAPEVTLTTANALWGRADVRFDSAFMRRVHEGYGAEVAALDLSTPEALARINAWASAATAGKIPLILAKAPPPETALVLTNAIYFKGLWESAFAPERTTERPFHRNDGTTLTHPMMTQVGYFGYAVGKGFRLARLPYRGGEISMYIVLPDSGQTLDAVAAGLGVEEFRTAFATAAASTSELALALPRFKLECAASLTQPLSALGAANAFDRNRADFSRLITPGIDAPGHMWLGSALQRSFIEVNEEGTEAAAVTAIGIMMDSMPEPFTVDHPFLFAIRHDPTGALLFVGQVMDPAGECGSRG